ncbi:1,4-dihydroxy-2-naphthoate octaprenyltransferase [Kordia antarctica]|uniref:1,4-dihydroxy-2-naphthoate octaprenyltransferase n=1 Tax=Kordia antarctica TaxID=1218801 RepID=A0A7L4ZMZ9_9FLAO|nr:UbiA family prenyltransferase [Kordia antarctica]QHI38042.1 1,4-dihydroxy-2-naphthoate octaprenyltransferase [Kordia antarctica]
MNFNHILAIIKPKVLLWFTVSTCLGFSAMILQKVPDYNFVFLVVVISLVNIGAILINDIGDIDVDMASPELSKRDRLIASGKISEKTAWSYVCIVFLLALVISIFHSIYAFVFVMIIMVFSYVYSIPPLRFCERPYGSILYWIILIGTCYIMMYITLNESIEVSIISQFSSVVFTSGVVFFIGIAEIIAKDLRDYKNDIIGGRNTFVNHLGIRKVCWVMIVTAWIGIILWGLSFFISSNPINIFSSMCIVVGIIWCIRVTTRGISLIKKYHQPLAKTLHADWTMIYAIMQILTFLAFI